jgi:hypothetical protein
MPMELTEFLQSNSQVLLLLAALVAIVLIFEAANRTPSRRGGKRHTPWRKPYGEDAGSRNQTAPQPRERTPVTDSVEQMRVVMQAEFSAQPVLNKSEARVFRELSKIVAEIDPNWSVMAQVSLGEVLRSKDQEAYRCINSKRVDLLLMDGACMPRHAIEYQGEGHHQRDAAARDAVKKEALRRAGVGYHEVVAGQTTPADLKRLVQKLIAQ